MAAVTNTNGPYTVVLGPIKVECVNVASVDDADTYSSRLQRPLWAAFVPGNDANGDAPLVNCAVSGKTITFNGSALSASAGTLLVFGF